MMIRVDKSLPELSFLLAKQSLLPHPLLVREVLQSLNPFVAFSWTPSPVCVSHTGHWDAQNWALLLWVVEGRITSVTLQHPAACAIGLVCGTLLAPVQLQDPRAFSAKGFSSWVAPGYISVWDCSPQRISPACRGPYGWQQDPQVYQPGFVSPAALLRACSAHHP